MESKTQRLRWASGIGLVVVSALFVVWAMRLGRWETAMVIAGAGTLAAVWSWASASIARPRTYVATGLGIGLLTLIATLAVPTDAVECSSANWPAFMLSGIRNEQGAERQGWILWCHETHWTMHVAGEFAGETASRQARGTPAEVFPWFSPSLTPHEAWQRLTGSPEMRQVEPRHDLAAVAFTRRSDAGPYRMEFTPEGIPVVVRVPGTGGFRFRADVVSFAGRPMRSDDEIMNWPACAVPRDGDSVNEPRPCWRESGSADYCAKTLNELTSQYSDLGCAL